MFTNWRGWIVVAMLAVSWAEVSRAEPQRLRVVVETDAGGDPDDEQSLVRFLLYTCEWDVEGIIANRGAARDRENLNSERTGLGIVRRQVQAYADCYANLKQHDPRYPSPELLFRRTVPGDEGADEGVQRMIDALDADDPRPVWFLNWGTDHGAAPSCLIRSLDRIRERRGQAAYAAAKNKLRVIGYPKLFGEHAKSTPPALRMLVNTFQPELDRQRWYHRFSALTAKAGEFDIRRDVLTGHGPLGALYPLNTTHPQKEGDTMTFLYLVPTGMNDPMEPGWGSWAGRYGRASADEPHSARDDVLTREMGTHYYWANQQDTWKGTTHRENTLARWAADLQNDFRARLDWCVADYSQANHPPEVVLHGHPAGEIVRMAGRAGTTLEFDAAGSKDPDGDELHFQWWTYDEAGTFRGRTEWRNAEQPRTSLAIPAAAAGRTIHAMLTVRDTGSPPLARYRRVVVQVAAAGPDTKND